MTDANKDRSLTASNFISMQQLQLFDTPDVRNRLIISLFDYTGNWAKPYIDAGYPVTLWDAKVEGCLLEYYGTFLEQIQDAMSVGYKPYGILAAPPCTAFAVSGARWWANKDKVRYNEFGDYAYTSPVWTNEFATQTEEGIYAVMIALQAIDDIEAMMDEPLKFWALENPVGRLENLVPELKPHRRLIFDPCDYGDSYTKKTILWGNFNAQLPRKAVQPVEGSKMHKLAPAKDRQALRSATPMGFANAFFQANP